MIGAQEKLVHCLSFDVEEHFQVSAFWSESRRRQWDQLESRVERNTMKLADMLARYHTRATFFVLGWVAERCPDLVKSLARAGHEIASHGYGHELVTAQTPEQFRQDVSKAKKILEDLTGQLVIGYRAPSFSISAKTPWALPTLAEEGYLYDSSIYNRFQGSAGAKKWERHYIVDTPMGKIWEVPPSTMSLFGFQLPVAGGGYFRLFPYGASKYFLKQLEKQGNQLIMYLHPWEIDPEQPRMDGPPLSRFRHYLNLRKTEGRLQNLLRDFRFSPIREAIASVATTCPGVLDIGVDSLEESGRVSHTSASATVSG